MCLLCVDGRFSQIWSHIVDIVNLLVIVMPEILVVHNYKLYVHTYHTCTTQN